MSTTPRIGYWLDTSQLSVAEDGGDGEPPSHDRSAVLAVGEQLGGVAGVPNRADMHDRAGVGEDRCDELPQRRDLIGGGGAGIADATGEEVVVLDETLVCVFLKLFEEPDEFERVFVIEVLGDQPSRVLDEHLNPHASALQTQRCLSGDLRTAVMGPAPPDLLDRTT